MKTSKKLFLTVMTAFVFMICAAFVGAQSDKLPCVDWLFEIKASAAKSGKCGDNVTWTLDDNGTLTISGKGAMWDLESHNGSTSIPQWEKVKKVIISNGVTSIGFCAFKNCINLTTVTIPKSVEKIGSSAFTFCHKLKSISIPNSIKLSDHVLLKAVQV